MQEQNNTFPNSVLIST